jgi:WXG100 family type VII secretion target
MSATMIQSRYDDLAAIAARFGEQAEQSTALHHCVRQCADTLTQEGWEGEGVLAFRAEMDDEVFPALQRLIQALQEGRAVTLEASAILQQAEEEAATLFQGGEMAGVGAAANGDNTTSNVSTGPDSSGPFQVGPPQRPNIQHDNGFLEHHAPAEPTFGDHASLLKWKAKLEGAEAFRPDLADGTAAYRHFLEGDGADRHIDYERFLHNDPSGQTALKNLIIDAQRHAEVIGTGRDDFSITSDAYNIGSDARFPYPETENWQKALGGHNVWTSADVQATGEPPNRTYTMEITLHMEDRYNFNPSQKDIATGIPDNENGRFEITGLAHQYMNYGEVTRVVTWNEGDIQNAQITDQDTSRNRRPPDNRRIRNQL